MKRPIFILVTVTVFFVVFSCGTAPESTGPDAEKEKTAEAGRTGTKKEELRFDSPQAVLKQWEEALMDEDADRYAELYWPDAVKEIDLINDKFELRGREQILRQQQQLWDNFDVSGVEYSDPEVEQFPESNEVFFHFNQQAIGMHEHILLRERDGEWRIFEHFIRRHWHLAVKTDFQAWADENRSGWLEPEEYKTMHRAAVKLIMSPHENATAVDQYFDINSDGAVGPKELRLARLYFFGPSLSRLTESERFSPEWLDINGNGKIDEPERKGAAAFAMQFNHFDVEEKPVENKLEEQFDMNGNGTLEREEQIETFYRIYEPLYMMAHTGETIQQFTASIRDRGEDGEEAVAGAVGLEDADIPPEPEGSAGFEQKPVEDLNNKKIAVVGVENLHSSISDETIEGLLLFIENSFVNSKKVRVIDRKNIEKITEEYQFQSTSLTDEDTAVEIGKLANADYIVTGALSKVGERYYLNVKMIDVESGEIVGSSISDASVEDVFYEMCNTAVKRIMKP